MARSTAGRDNIEAASDTHRSVREVGTRTNLLRRRVARRVEACRRRFRLQNRHRYLGPMTLSPQRRTAEQEVVLRIMAADVGDVALFIRNGQRPIPVFPTSPRRHGSSFRNVAF